MDQQIEFLKDLTIIFGWSAIVVYLFAKIRIPSIVGFLVSGVLLGPHGLSLIQDKHTVEILAEIGVVLLLFTVGLEFSMTKMAQMGKMVFLGGGLQVILTVFVTASLFYPFYPDIRGAIFAGFLVALSSTAVVLRILMDRGEIHSLQGLNITSILVFQDLCVVPMMILTPALAGQETEAGEFLLLSLKAALLLVAIFAGAKWVVPTLLYQTVKTRNRELFIIVILLMCLGTALLTYMAGLSLALGAFLAGMMISDSEYSHQVVAEILPFRDSLNSLFFVSIGMLLDLHFVLQNPGLVIAATLGIIIIKLPLAAIPTLAFRYPLRFAFTSGMALSQVGEFSFVLMQFGQKAGMDLGGHYQTFLAAAIITMASTPFLISMAPTICDLLIRRGNHAENLRESPLAEYDKVKDHVIIVGFGLNGRNLARVLRSSGVPYNILEMNAATVRKYMPLGEPIHYGDATRQHMLNHVGISSARVFVLAISDPSVERRIVPLVRQMNPDIHIIARTRFVTEVEPLRMLGADEVIPEEFETSIEIFSHVLRKYDVPHNIVLQHIEDVRSSEYMMLRSVSKPEKETPLEAMLKNKIGMESISIMEDSRAAGMKLLDLDIRKRSGASVLAIQREADFTTNPPPDFVFKVDDVVHLVGNSQQLKDAAEILLNDRKAPEEEKNPPA